MADRWGEIRKLRRGRRRSPFVRYSLLLVLAIFAYAWLCGEVETGDFLSERRRENLARFADRVAEGGAFSTKAGEIFAERGFPGMTATLAIAVLAIVMAGATGALLCLPAARNFMRPDPFVDTAGRRGGPRGLLLGAAVRVTRLLQLFLRSVPEYVWAYLFLTILGPTAWPAVLALAIHNTGTLGKLGSEVVENLEPAAPRALRSLGAPRFRIAWTAIFPLALPRFLLYFFYRFETCVREATILGLLGIVSLGYYIEEARAMRAYGEMLFLVLLGAAIVLLGDLISAGTRRLVRRAA